MARFWKEPYTEDKALDAGIHDHEDAKIVGPPGARWIYYVEVCGFTFAFFSLRMIQEYRDFYAQTILPSSRLCRASPYSRGAAASKGDGQTKFERLPLWLRKEPRRQKVLKALERALTEFGAGA